MVDKNYGIKYYKAINVTSKRKVIDAFIDELTNMQLDMIDEAVTLSDMQQANDVIKFIKEKL